MYVKVSAVLLAKLLHPRGPICRLLSSPQGRFLCNRANIGVCPEPTYRECEDFHPGLLGVLRTPPTVPYQLMYLQ